MAQTELAEWIDTRTAASLFGYRCYTTVAHLAQRGVVRAEKRPVPTTRRQRKHHGAGMTQMKWFIERQSMVEWMATRAQRIYNGRRQPRGKFTKGMKRLPHKPDCECVICVPEGLRRAIKVLVTEETLQEIRRLAPSHGSVPEVVRCAIECYLEAM